MNISKVQYSEDLFWWKSLYVKAPKLKGIPVPDQIKE